MFGVSTLSFDVLTLKVVSIKAMTINAGKLAKDPLMAAVMGDRFRRISLIGEVLTDLLEELEPLGISCESPFFNPGRPNAFAPLVEVLTEVKKSVSSHSRLKPLYLIDPPTVKKAVGAEGRGVGGKEAMKDAFRKLTELTPLFDPPLESLDEHAVDASAVAYCLYKDYVNGKVKRLGEFG